MVERYLIKRPKAQARMPEAQMGYTNTAQISLCWVQNTNLMKSADKKKPNEILNLDAIYIPRQT